MRTSVFTPVLTRFLSFAAEQNLQDLARRTAAGESPLGAGALNVLTRRKPQKDSTARILAAKKRAANKTKRAAAPIASVQALHYTSGEKAKYNSYIDTSCVKSKLDAF